MESDEDNTAGAPADEDDTAGHLAEDAAMTDEEVKAAAGVEDDQAGESAATAFPGGLTKISGTPFRRT